MADPTGELHNTDLRIGNSINRLVSQDVRQDALFDVDTQVWVNTSKVAFEVIEREAMATWIEIERIANE